MLTSILNIVLLVCAIAMVVLILLQHGRGADAGAAFGGGGGGGSSQSLFGARGSANFLSKSTAVIALVFFVTALTMAWLAAQRTANQSVAESTPVVESSTPVESDLPSTPGESTEGGTDGGDVPQVPAQ